MSIFSLHVFTLRDSIESLTKLASVFVILLFSYGCVTTQKPVITQHLDKLVVMETSKKLLNKGYIGQFSICKELLAHYQDAFDLIVIVSNVPYEEQDLDQLGYAGGMYVVRNSTLGIGVTLFDRGKRFGSSQKLKGVIHLPARNLIINGPTLHEIMHLWIDDVEVIPTVVGDHWGFSDVHGQLGGFDKEQFAELGNNQYSAGNFFINANGGNSVPYSPLELYLAGWIPAREVPDIWVLEDGRWVIERGTIKRDLEGNKVFTGKEISHWSIEKIVERIGERVPSYKDSQRVFQLAVVLVGNDKFPVTKADIETVSAQVDLFSRKESIRHLQGFENIYNFWEATGGRAVVETGSLQQFLMEENVATK